METEEQCSTMTYGKRPHDWKAISIIDNIVSYKCRSCEKTKSVIEENKCYALTKACSYTNPTLKVIDKTDIEEVNKTERIFEFLNPADAQSWMKENYPDIKNLRKHQKYDHEFFSSWTIYPIPRYLGKDLDELEDYAVKYGKMYIEIYDTDFITGNKSHSVQEFSGTSLSGGSSYVIDGLFILDHSRYFYFDENAKNNIKKKVEKSKVQKTKNAAFPAYALDNLFYSTLRFWIEKYHQNLTVSITKRQRLTKEDKINVIYKIDKDLKGIKYSKKLLQDFEMFMPTMTDYKGKKGEENFVKELPKFKKFLQKKMKK